MKININTIKGVNFSEILVGECFVHAGQYYLKTDSNDCGNAVKLKTGEHFTFVSYNQVLPIDAEVHICRKEEDNVKS